MRSEEPVHAYIYPVLRDHIDNLFEGKDVFCKYTGQKNVGIGAGTKILLYASASGRKVRGEGTVIKVEYLTPQQAISQYSQRLFISPKELDEYRGLRSPDIKLLVMMLENIKKYAEPIVLEKPLTMTGQKLSKKQYCSLVRQVKR